MVILPIGLLFASLAAFTQISISVDDLEYQEGEYNKMYGRTTLYIVQGLTGKIGGPHTWDFSTGPTDIDYTVSYVLPSTTPCSADFPLATIAEQLSGEGADAYLFLDFQAGVGRVNYGACQPPTLPDPYVFNPPIIDFPATIDFMDSWVASTSFPADQGGFNVIVNYTSTSFCNAYGTLSLPNGLGDRACLQVNSLEHFIFYWSGFPVGETYIRNYYWLIEDGGIAVIIASEEGESAPPDDFAYSSAFNRMYESSKMTVSNEFSLNITAMLEGPYNSTSGQMNTLLNPTLIPLSQPFIMPPWDYAGTESVLSIPDIDIVDWVLIELRDTTQASLAIDGTRLARQAAFIKKDGSVVSMDGLSYPMFDLPVINDLFLIIWHKNHLGVISADPLVNLSGIYGYNFTNGPDKAYGGSNAQNDVNTGVWALISGDANSDGDISLLDHSTSWIPSAGNSGYLNSDDNLDGHVNNQDKNDYLINNIGKTSYIPE